MLYKGPGFLGAVHSINLLRYKGSFKHSSTRTFAHTPDTLPHIIPNMSDASSMRRPVEIQEFEAVIKDLPEGQLAKIRSELENSMRHLDRSNLRLKKYIAKIEGKREDTPDGVDQEELDKVDANDLQLFQDSFRENEIVLRNHYERLEALDLEESYRQRGARSAPSAASGSSQSHTSRAPAFDSDNTGGDTNAPNSVYL